MPHISRIVLFISAPLAIAALLICASPAGAKFVANKLAANGISQTGVAMSARITTGSSLSDLNGVSVEAVIIPNATLR